MPALLAKDVMRKRVVTATPDMTLRQLLRLFTDHGIGGAPVLGKEGDLAGMVSQSDLVLYERGGSDDLDRVRVAEVMTPWVVSCEWNTPVVELARLMRRKRIHRVAITRDGRLCGIVTTIDMLRVIERAGPSGLRR